MRPPLEIKSLGPGRWNDKLVCLEFNRPATQAEMKAIYLTVQSHLRTADPATPEPESVAP